MRRVCVVLSCLVLSASAYAEPAKQKRAVPAAKAAKTKAPKAEPKTKQPSTATQTTSPANNPIAASYAAMPLAARVSIQADLVMIGDYAGALNGEFTDAAISAVKAFQTRKGNQETGVLNPKERAELATAAKPKQTQRGWLVVDDTTAGVRLFVPTKMMPQQSQIPGGSRWASARGEMVVETFRAAQSGVTLAAVFEQMKKGPPGRRVAQSSLSGDSFEISGLQNLKLFHVRGTIKNDEVRGFTVLYDQALDGIMAPVVTAMTNAFVAFPVGVAALPAKSKVEYASGFAVSDQGHIVTDREALDGCHVMTVSGIGGADKVAEDKDKGLLLLRVYGARQLKPVALAGETTKAGDLTLIGIVEPDAQGGGREVSVARARVNETRVEPPPGPGFTGAAALDPQGRLTGMVTLKPALVAGSGAGPQAALLPVETIRNFLDAQNVAPAVGAAPGVDAAKGAVVRVICVRK